MLLADLERIIPRRFTSTARQHWRSLLGGIASTFDTLTEGVLQARLAALPGFRDVPGGNGFDDVSALELTGRDRNIRPGLMEWPWDWAKRQTEYQDAWARSATPMMMLEQLAAILSPNPPRVWLVTGNSVWWVRFTDGTFACYNLSQTGFAYNPVTGAISIQSAPSWTWDWDSVSDPVPSDQNDPSRVWVGIDMPANDPYLMSDRGPVGDGIKADCFWDQPSVSGAQQSPNIATLGTVAPWKEVENIRSLGQEWRAAGCKIAYWILNLDATAFQPTTDSTPTSVPDGQWAWHSYYDAGSNRRLPGRFASARYWPGDPGGGALQP